MLPRRADRYFAQPDRHLNLTGFDDSRRLRVIEDHFSIVLLMEATDRGCIAASIVFLAISLDSETTR